MTRRTSYPKNFASRFYPYLVRSILYGIENQNFSLLQQIFHLLPCQNCLVSKECFFFCFLCVCVLPNPDETMNRAQPMHPISYPLKVIFPPTF